MQIELSLLRPKYMSDAEISASDIYLQKSVVFEDNCKYLIKAHSGKGKSSLLNFIYGSNNNYEGSITFHNCQQSLTEKRINKISYVFQDFKLFNELTCLENIRIKNNITHYKTDNEIIEMITKVGLSHKTNSLVKNLSLGQRQRIAIIRALCQPFKYLLLDEPFSHLDTKNIQTLSEMINTEVNDQKASIILTSLGNDMFFEYNKILNL